MKTMDDLAKMLEKWANNIDKRMMEQQQKTAQKIRDDVISFAIFKDDTGTYKNSIKVEPTQNDGEKITTFIGSDLMVGPTIHGEIDNSKNAPAGSMYNLGYLLEHGTFEHAIPNAFGYGFYHSFTDASGRFHKGTLDTNWHPGSVAIPHYTPALLKNEKLIKDDIKLAWRGK